MLLQDGKNALHMAASEGHLEVATLLISKGADVNAADKVRVLLLATVSFI